MKTTLRVEIRRTLAKARRLIRGHRKAIAGLLGPGAAILAVPLAQLQLPSSADWRHAAAAAITGAVAVYFAPANRS